MLARSLLCFLILLSTPVWAADPALPTSFVDTDTIPTVDGTTFTVNAGGSIQTAINSAAASNGALTHEIVIQAGATFTGDLTLPAKNGTNPSGTGWILIRTSNLAGIASQKQRIIPATHTSAMPKVQVGSISGPYGIETAQGAHHYRFIGIEFIRNSGSVTGNLFQIWSFPGNTLASIPNNIVIDRCILRTTTDTNKVVAMQVGSGNAVIDSDVKNNTTTQGDSNAIWMFNGPGPAKIENNYLSAMGETMFFGAAEYVPSYATENIEVKRNLIRNPTPQISGAAGKNLFETKNAVRLWVHSNIFEDGWVSGQAWNIQLSPQTESTTDALSVVNDLTIEYNLFRRLRAGVAFSGQGFGQTGVHMTRAALRNNFFDSVGDYGGSGHQATYNNGCDQVTIDHNTFRNAGGNGVRFESTVVATNWIHKNTIVDNDVVSAAGGGTGTNALNVHTSGRVFTKNVLVGAVASYTGTDLTQNFFPPSISLNTDGSLPPASPYKNQATDGTDIGADFTTLYGTTLGVGQFSTGLNDYYAYTGQWPPSAPDVTAPSAPTNLNVTTISSSQLDLSWTASTDNVGVTGYRIERCLASSCTFTQVGTSTGVNFSDLGLASSTIYRYQVRAEDAAGNLSAYSSVATGTTAAVDGTAPTAPTNLTATAVSSSQINLAWTASTDNVAVTGYRVERCTGSGCSNFAQIATPTSVSYSDTGLSASTLYRYQVRATDAAGNLSAYSSIAQDTTSAASAGITVDAVSSAQNTGSTATLSWTHSGGSSTLAIVGVTINTGSVAVTSATYGGQTMTLLKAQAPGGQGFGRVEIWYLATPPTGTQTVSVTLASATSKIAGAITLAGTATSSIFGTVASTTGSSTTASVAVNSAVGELVVSVLGINLPGASNSATVGSGQTERWNLFEASVIRGGGSTASGALPTVTPTWTLSPSMEWTLVGVSVAPGASSPTAFTSSTSDAPSFSELLLHDDSADTFTIDLPTFTETLTPESGEFPTDAPTLSESLTAVTDASSTKPPVSSRPATDNRPPVNSRPPVTSRPPV